MLTLSCVMMGLSLLIGWVTLPLGLSAQSRLVIAAILMSVSGILMAFSPGVWSRLPVIIGYLISGFRLPSRFFRIRYDSKTKWINDILQHNRWINAILGSMVMLVGVVQARHDVSVVASGIVLFTHSWILVVREYRRTISVPV